MCPGSGGWSYLRPNDKKAYEGLPPIQLYNLKNDPGETIILQAEYLAVVAELKELLSKYIKEGRSTPGAVQENDDFEDEWKHFMNMSPAMRWHSHAPMSTVPSYTTLKTM